MFKTENDTLIITHNAGLFSCCTIKLTAIIDYMNRKMELPKNVNSAEQFLWYKHDVNQDLTNVLFEYDRVLEIYYSGYAITDLWGNGQDQQFTPYQELDFLRLTPFVNKYFALGDEPRDRVDQFKKKYNIHPVEPMCSQLNICGIFYRGNDKFTETVIAPYEEFILQAQVIKAKEPAIKFLVLPDEEEFLYAFTNAFPEDTITINENPMIKKESTFISATLPPEERPRHAVNFLATVFILSQCRYLITHSGNGGMWATLYRGNANGVIQYLNGEWHINSI